MKKVLSILVFTFFFLNVQGQENGPGNWLIYIGSKQLNSKWNLHHEVQYRNYNTLGDLEQLLLRTGLGYQLSSRSNFLLGYGYINSENFIGNVNDQITIEEHRIFERDIHAQKVTKPCFEITFYKSLFKPISML